MPLKSALIVFFAVWLTACSTTAKHTALRPNVSPSAHWAIQGRAALSDGQQSWQIKWRWQQTVDGIDFRVKDPLGQTHLHIHGKLQHKVHIKTAERQETTSNLNHWITQNYHWQLPLQQLRYWIMAKPVPEVSFQAQVNDQQQLTQLQQTNWLIHYLAYTQDTPTHPKKIKLSHQSWTLKLVIDEWTWLP